ncbi:hypothetical protein [Neorhizobium sp. DAR64861/K0K2]|uniref:hypothetical protein n=1 Tax=unclassified Neorhizobium TaxID=2629175 RepID=UPI003D2BEB13
MIQHDAAIVGTINLLAALIISLRDKGVYSDEEVKSLVQQAYAAGGTAGKGNVKELYETAFKGLKLV